MTEIVIKRHADRCSDCGAFHTVGKSEAEQPQEVTCHICGKRPGTIGIHDEYDTTLVCAWCARNVPINLQRLDQEKP